MVEFLEGNTEKARAHFEELYSDARAGLGEDSPFSYVHS